MAPNDGTRNGRSSYSLSNITKNGIDLKLIQVFEITLCST